MRSYKRDFWYSLISVTLSALIVFCILMFIRHERLISYNKVADAHFNIFSAVIKDATNVLEKLNSLQVSDCDQSTLINQALFGSAYVRNVGFIDTHGILKCTTGLGILSQSHQTSADYILDGGLEIKLNTDLMLFDKQYDAMIIKNLIML